MDVRSSIINQNNLNFPNNIDIKLKGLIELMLEKNQLIRPNIEDILMIDFVHDRLVSLIEEKKFKMDFLDKIINGRKTCIYELMELHSHKKEIDIAFALMHNSISQNYKGGFFSSTIHDCYTSNNLIFGFLELNQINIDNPTKFFDSLINLKILDEVSHKGEGFIQDNTHFYKFSFNYAEEFSNINYRIIDTEAPLHYNLLDISSYTLLNAIEIFNRIIIEGLEDILIQNTSYLNLLTGISFFQKYKIRSLDLDERAALLCNVYQIMLIHHRLNNYYGFTKKAGMLSLIKNNPEITYTFADFTLNNLEIKHALFRGNKKPPNNYLRLLSDNDSKLGILDLDKNQRLKCLFVAQEFGPNDYDMSLYQLRIFTRKGFNEQLNEFMKDFYNKKIKFDNSDSSYSSSIIEEYKNLKIPLYIYHYISDFGRPEDFYSFLFQYDNKEKSNEDLMNNIYKLVQKVITKEINVTFE